MDTNQISKSPVWFASLREHWSRIVLVICRLFWRHIHAVSLFVTSKWMRAFCNSGALLGSTMHALVHACVGASIYLFVRACFYAFARVVCVCARACLCVRWRRDTDEWFQTVREDCWRAETVLHENRSYFPEILNKSSINTLSIKQSSIVGVGSSFNYLGSPWDTINLTIRFNAPLMLEIRFEIRLLQKKITLSYLHVTIRLNVNTEIQTHKRCMEL